MGRKLIYKDMSKLIWKTIILSCENCKIIKTRSMLHSLTAMDSPWIFDFTKTGSYFPIDLKNNGFQSYHKIKLSCSNCMRENYNFQHHYSLISSIVNLKTRKNNSIAKNWRVFCHIPLDESMGKISSLLSLVFEKHL